MKHTPQPSGLTLGLRQQPQAYRTLKRVVQFIHAHGLHQGDRLPVHQELARQLSVSNDTLTTVMRELSQLGVLQRRTRAGTVVANLDAVPSLVWSIGLATVPASTSGPCSFFAELGMRIQQEVARRNWRCSTYYHFSQAYPSELDWFGPLSEDLRCNTIDALITLAVVKASQWQAVEQFGVTGMHCGIDEKAPNAVLIDEGAMAIEALEVLRDRGCRSVAAVSVFSPGNETSRFRTYLNNEARKLGIAIVAEKATLHITGVEGGLTLADRLLAMPAEQRPDGLIVLDDFIALGMTNRLANTGDYRPHLAVKAHKQLPLAYALPVIRFETDIEELAQAAIARLHRQLIDPSLSADRDWIAPRLLARQPQRMPGAQDPSPASLS